MRLIAHRIKFTAIPSDTDPLNTINWLLGILHRILNDRNIYTTIHNEMWVYHYQKALRSIYDHEVILYLKYNSVTAEYEVLSRGVALRAFTLGVKDMVIDQVVFEQLPDGLTVEQLNDYGG